MADFFYPKRFREECVRTKTEIETEYGKVAGQLGDMTYKLEQRVILHTEETARLKNRMLELNKELSTITVTERPTT